MRNKIIQIVLILIVLLLSISIKYAENNEPDKDINIILDEFEKDIKQSLNIFKKELEVTVNGEFMEQDVNDKRRLVDVTPPGIVQQFKELLDAFLDNLDLTYATEKNDIYVSLKASYEKIHKVLEPVLDPIGKKLREFKLNHGIPVGLRILSFSQRQLKKDRIDKLVEFKLCEEKINHCEHQTQFQLTIIYEDETFYRWCEVYFSYSPQMQQQVKKIFEFLNRIFAADDKLFSKIRDFVLVNYQQMIKIDEHYEIPTFGYKEVSTDKRKITIKVNLNDRSERLFTFEQPNFGEIFHFQQLLQPSLTKESFDKSDLGKELKEVIQKLQDEKKKEATKSGKDNTHTKRL